MSAPQARSRKILLINPWIHDFAAHDFFAKPHGLLILGGLLRDHGHEIQLIDCLDMHHPGIEQHPGYRKIKKQPSGTGKILNEIIAPPPQLPQIRRAYKRYGITEAMFMTDLETIGRPDVILVTSQMTYWYPGVFRAIALCKSIYPDVPVALGGIYATLCPEHARRFSGADLVVSGPAEDYLIDLIERLAERQAIVDQNSWRAPSIPPPHEARPCFELQPQLDYVSLLTSRGCPFHCHYCASAKLYPGFYQRSIPAVWAELKFWWERGVRNIAFYDDALFFRREQHIIPILRGLTEQGHHFSFHTPNGLDLLSLDASLAKLLFESGFSTLRLSLDLYHQSDTPLHGRPGKVRAFFQAVEHLFAAGFAAKQLGVYFLVGLPFQEFRLLHDQIGLIRQAGIKIHLAEYSPIPGTALFAEAQKCSRFDLASDPIFHNNTLIPCQSPQLSYEQIQELKDWARTVMSQS
jgi:hypothetical protein